MKKYIFLLLLIVLITSCTPKVEVDIAKPAEETPKEEIKEVIKEESKEQEIPELEEENNIEIKEDSFYPKEKTIEKNTEIRWIKKDPRMYKVACYLEGNRIALSPDLKENDSFTYRFLKEGEYICITFPYGLRNIIKVEAKTSLLSPTGSAVINEGTTIEKASLAAIALIAIIILLFFIYGRKR